MEVPTTRPEVTEVLSALAVECHHLAVEDRLLDRQLLTDPVDGQPWKVLTSVGLPS